MQSQSTKQSFMLGRAHKIMCSDSNCKMFTHLNFQRKFWRARNEILKFKIFRHEKDYNPPTTLPPKRRAPTAEKFAEIYPKRKGSDSPGDFGFERTGKINFRTL